MNKIIVIILSLLTYKSIAQVDERELRDTVQFITQEVERLNTLRFNQKIVKLNFDDCNLEIHKIPIENPDKWIVYSFWLPKLNEAKMQLLQKPEGEWHLVLRCDDSDIQFDTDTGSGWISEVSILSTEKEPLISIGQALYYATRQCKGLDRFKK